MFRDVSVSAVTAGLLAAFVGFASSFAVVLHGLEGVGATPAEAASGLMALSVAMGLSGMILSSRLKIPVSVAWSTPGAALLAGAGVLQGGFAAAIGAFVVCGLLIMLAGFWKPLGRAVGAIPAPLANAMLAGILLGLCLAPVRAIEAEPAMGLAIVVVWAVVARIRRVLAVPAAVIFTGILIAMTTEVPPGVVAALVPRPVVVPPVFEPAALFGIALPLFIVTMASQNIPGMAVLTVNGYRPDLGPMLRLTGAASVVAAPFGAQAVNLAAITAAMCAGPEAHPDPNRRWVAAFVSGAAYVVLGPLSGAAAAFIAASPPVLIEAVAGLALLGAFAGALANALSAPDHREAAVVTFLVTASGIGFFGVGGAFWGLLAGGAMMGLSRLGRPTSPRAG